MEKPYDLKALGKKIIEEAGKEGLPLAEEAAEKLAKSAYFAIKSWSKESAALSPNKADDFVVQFSDFLDPYVLPAIEKLDLDKDGK